jgi:hypothetical protein
MDHSEIPRLYKAGPAPRTVQAITGRCANVFPLQGHGFWRRCSRVIAQLLADLFIKAGLQ